MVSISNNQALLPSHLSMLLDGQTAWTIAPIPATPSTPFENWYFAPILICRVLNIRGCPHVFFTHWHFFILLIYYIIILIIFLIVYLLNNNSCLGSSHSPELLQVASPIPESQIKTNPALQSPVQVVPTGYLLKSFIRADWLQDHVIVSRVFKSEIWQVRLTHLQFVFFGIQECFPEVEPRQYWCPKSHPSKTYPMLQWGVHIEPLSSESLQT